MNIHVILIFGHAPITKHWSGALKVSSKCFDRELNLI